MSSPTPGPEDRDTGPVDPVPAGSEPPTAATPAGAAAPAGTPATTTPAASPAAGPAGRARGLPRVTGRRLAGAGVVLALLVVGGVLALLLVPHGRGGEGPGRGGPGFAAEGHRFPGDPAGRGDDRRGGERLGGEGRGGPGAGGRADDAAAAIVGSVRSVGPGTLVVARDGAGEVTVRTDDRTRVRGVTTELAALTPGERVVVRVSGTGAEAVAVSVQTPRARVTGTVTQLVGARATVVGASGLASAVDVTGLTTKPSVGTRAEFGGAATADGTVLRADEMQTLPEPR